MKATCHAQAEGVWFWRCPSPLPHTLIRSHEVCMRMIGTLLPRGNKARRITMSKGRRGEVVEPVLNEDRLLILIKAALHAGAID